MCRVMHRQFDGIWPFLEETALMEDGGERPLWKHFLLTKPAESSKDFVPVRLNGIRLMSRLHRTRRLGSKISILTELKFGVAACCGQSRSSCPKLSLHGKKLPIRSVSLCFTRNKKSLFNLRRARSELRQAAPSPRSSNTRLYSSDCHVVPTLKSRFVPRSVR